MSYMQSKEYLEYLIQNCGVRGYDYTEPLEVCKRPDVDIVLAYSEWLNLQPDDRVLEVGCGLGRILKELHDRWRMKPSGIDVFEDAILEARKRVSHICDRLEVGRAEKTDFSHSWFDKIICWGVFDLTEQGEALREMTRILKPGGFLLLTGKSDYYHLDDGEAFAAEAASRKKGIPNHYTDVRAMLQWADLLSLILARARFFPRRGDFSKDFYVQEMPERFYEYVMLFQRVGTEISAVRNAPAVGRDISRSFLEGEAK